MLTERAKHTQGPWEALQDTVKADGRTIVEVFNGSWPQHIANTHEASLYLAEERRANARLIAAAPDLLETLEEVRIALNKIGFTEQHLSATSTARHAVIAVETAIQKAKGE